MSIKQHLFLLCTFVLLVACTSGEKNTAIQINFKVSELTVTEAVVVYNAQVCPVKLDEQGEGSFLLEGVNVLYANIFYGEQYKQVYLEQGDNTVVSFNGKDFDATFRMEGDKAPVADYLNHIKLIEIPEEAYGLSLSEFNVGVERQIEKSIKLMQDNHLSHIGRFEQSESARIRYHYAAALLMYPIGHSMLTQTVFEPDETYLRMVDKYFVEDETLAYISEYRAFMAEAARTLSTEANAAKNPLRRIVAQMNYITDHIKSSLICQLLLNDLACTYVEQNGIHNIDEMQNIIHTYVTDPALKADFDARCHRWDLGANGKFAPQFKAVDRNGNVHQLSDYRGKYVYIDLWASWCGPCKRELPHLKTLHEKLRDKNIVILGLSIDTEKDKWEAHIDQDKTMPGIQLYLGRNSSFQRAYNVDGIPRFILIDPEGKTVNNNMNRPSDPDIVKILLDLLNQNN